MPVRGPIAVTAVATLLAAPPALAAGGDYCVGLPERDGCVQAETLADALGREDRTRILLGEGTFAAPAAGDGGVPVEIAGLGPGRTIVRDLRLSSPGSRLADVSTEGALRVAGRAERIAAGDGVELTAANDGTVAQLAQAVVTGAVVVSGAGRLDSVEARTVQVRCAAVLARHVTAIGVRAACAAPDDAAELELRSSVLEGDDPVAVDGAAGVRTAFSAHAEDPDATAANRLEPAAALADAGDPAPLALHEPFEDAAGDIRITDGDGDGVLRRDAGAYELQPPAVAPPADNVLVNPGAEDGTPALGGPPPGWTGTFEAARYGDPFLPGTRAAAALAAGAQFFAGAGATDAWLMQRIDLAGAAAAIDGGGASASLSGLLGGYGADADAVEVSATFRDPEGGVLGRMTIGPVLPADRANTTTLLARATTAPIPARTRAIDVELRGERAAGAYTDAYADRLALVLSVPGVPVDPPAAPTDPVVPDLQPFAGVVVLTARPRVTPSRRAAVVVGCPSATVGRCSGTLELRARAPWRGTRVRVAPVTAFELLPGESRRLTLRLLGRARRAFRGRRTVTARLLTVARDDQGVERRRTVPVRLNLLRARR